MNTELRWLTIAEYGQLKGKSDSTIRRYIKMNLLRHKIENGKYYIQTSCQDQSSGNYHVETHDGLDDKIIELTKKLNHYKSMLNNRRIQNLEYLI